MVRLHALNVYVMCDTIIATLLPLLYAAIVSSEGLSLTADNIMVARQQSALLNCTLAGYSGRAGDLSIIISKTAGFFTPAK